MRRIVEKIEYSCLFRFLDRLITDLRSPPVGSLDPKGRPKKAISPGTAQRIVHLLSAFYVWLGKHHGVPNNSVRALKGDGDIRDLLRSTHDPKRVPFLKRKEDVAALFQALPPSINIVSTRSVPSPGCGPERRSPSNGMRSISTLGSS